MNLKNNLFMKLKFVLAVASLAVAMISCEKEQLEKVPVTPETPEVTGAKMSFSVNGAASFTYQSKGFGSLCPNPGTSDFVWALATGNNLVYDAVTQEFLPDMDNDTTFALAWVSGLSSTGTFSIPNPLTDAACFMITPTFLRQYDPSQIQVNVTSVTTDSIFGSYWGALPELLDIQFDPTTGAPIPVYTGVVDSVATTFKVQRNPC